MLKREAKQLNFHAVLYNKIPKNHILNLINSSVSFDFVYDLVKDSYCAHFGRPAKDPEMMVRILVLQHLYNLSDERIIEELQVNLAYMWFIGINPDENPPDASLLSKFRTLHLGDTTLDDILTEIVRQCIEKGIIKESSGISLDTTHIEANTTKKIPERIMKQLAQKIFKAEGIEDPDIPDYTGIEDHNEAKQVMKDFLEETIEKSTEKSSEEAAEAREILDSDLFIEQRGIRSLTDKDARVGKKSHTQYFFGYKSEYCVTTEGIITAIDVHDGAYFDGKDFDSLCNRTLEAGLKIAEFFGDKAYFIPQILNRLKELGTRAFIPVSASSYKIDEELYSYNKDSDQWFCRYGNETVKKSRNRKKRRQKDFESYRYYFKPDQCRNCPHRDECIKKARSVRKILEVSVNAPEYYEYSQFEKTDEFREKYKQRAGIERKNAEMKRFHGLARARGYGLRSVSLQAKFTALAVNLKRIAKLVSSSNDKKYQEIQLFLIKLKNTMRLKIYRDMEWEETT
jgi:transposase